MFVEGDRERDMKNETDGGGDGNSTTNAQENEGNIYLVDFAYGAFIREKELYAVLFAFFLAAATPLTLFVVARIIL